MRNIRYVVLLWFLCLPAFSAAQDLAVREADPRPAPSVSYLQRGKILTLVVSDPDVKAAHWTIFPFEATCDYREHDGGKTIDFTGEVGTYNLSVAAWNGTAQVWKEWIVYVQEGPIDPNPPQPPTPGQNKPPVAVADSYRTTVGRQLVAPSPGVLANDSDPDGDAISALVETKPTHGTAAIETTGALTYTPAANYVGADSFKYRVRDSKGASAVGLVTIDVAAAPSDPFQVALQAAYDAETSANKRQHASREAVFYRSAATVTVNDTRLATVDDLIVETARAIKTIGLPAGALSKVNLAIRAELNKTLPSNLSQPLDQATRGAAGVAYDRVAAALEGLR